MLQAVQIHRIFILSPAFVISNLFSEIPYILKSLSKKRAYGFLHTLQYHLTHLFISRP